MIRNTPMNCMEKGIQKHFYMSYFTEKVFNTNYLHPLINRYFQAKEDVIQVQQRPTTPPS